MKPYILRPFSLHCYGSFSSFDDFKKIQRRSKTYKYRHRHQYTHHFSDIRYARLQNHLNEKSRLQDHHHNILRTLLVQGKTSEDDLVNYVDKHNECDVPSEPVSTHQIIEHVDRRVLTDHSYALNLTEEETIVKCAYCGKELLMELLRDHMLEKHDGMATKCFMCHKEYYFEESLVQHIKVVHKLNFGNTLLYDRSYHVVKKQYIMKDRDEILKANKQRKLRRIIYNKPVVVYRAAVKSEKSRDVIDKSVVAGKRGKSDKASEKSVLRDHKAYHNGLTIKCFVCYRDFYFEESLVRHIKLIHKLDFAFVKMQHGVKSIDKAVKVDGRKRSSREMSICKVCEKTLPTEAHIRHLHEHPKCVICHEHYHENKLLEHVQTHQTFTITSSSNEKTYEVNREKNIPERDLVDIPCYVCQKKFKGIQKLIAHLMDQPPYMMKSVTPSGQACIVHSTENKANKIQTVRSEMSQDSLTNPTSIETDKVDSDTTVIILELSLMEHVALQKNHTEVGIDVHKSEKSDGGGLQQESSDSQLKAKVEKRKCKFTCGTCGKVFRNARLHLLHQANAHKNDGPTEELHKCIFCGQYKVTSKELYEHYDMAHSDKIIQCSECSYSSYNKANVKLHITKQHPDVAKKMPKFTCEMCNEFGTSDFYLLKRHKVAKHPETVHKCEKCKKVFLKWSHYERHKKFHNLNLQATTICSNCGQMFPNSSLYRLHRLQEHPETCFPCLICGKLFVMQSLATKHEDIHLPKLPKVRRCRAPKEYCRECKGVFLNKIELRKHKKEVHFARMGNCDICGKELNLKYMALHIRRHKGEQNHQCEICKCRFYTYADLDQHYRTEHDKKAPEFYECDRCDKIYLRKGTLDLHIRKVHDKTHVTKLWGPCEFCGKMFTTNTSLRDHIRIHTGEKPYKCKICGKAFAKDGNMKDHEKVHFGTQRKRTYKKCKTTKF